MGWIATVALALSLGNASQATTLHVEPEAFSPRAGSLTIESQLDSTMLVGVRVATGSGRILGWVVTPARRRALSVTWDGTFEGRELPQGYYQAQLVSGTLVMSTAAFRIDVTAPRLAQLRAENGGRPFAGDTRLLTTISPNGDGLRDSAQVVFLLDEPGRVTLETQRTLRETQTISSETRRFPAGVHVMTWAPPARTPPRTYILRLSAQDSAGNTRAYGPDSPFVERFPRAPVVRVLGIDASVPRPSYAPGQSALLHIATDAASLTMRVFRVGGEERPTYLPNELSGLPVSQPVQFAWQQRTDRPVDVRFQIGAWPTGLYYVQLEAPDGRIGYAPFVVRPGVFGLHSRVAVVLPTTTWQAYNFYDADGDGWGDTWYAGGRADHPVALGRPFLNRGVPPFFARYDIGFQTWLAQEGKTVDFLAETDLARLRTGSDLARTYDLLVFSGHTEYVDDYEYDVVGEYRDAGGNLAFLSANNFFWRVEESDGLLRRTALWRNLGRPEAGLIGVQYRANDGGGRQGAYLVRNAAAAQWLWAGTGLTEGSTVGDSVGGYGIEIDATTPDSPPGTLILAEIPDLLGPGLTAQMTYYETPAGAKVFAAGALDFCGSVMIAPIRRMLENLWTQLARP